MLKSFENSKYDIKHHHLLTRMQTELNCLQESIRFAHEQSGYKILDICADDKYK